MFTIYVGPSHFCGHWFVFHLSAFASLGIEQEEDVLSSGVAQCWGGIIDRAAPVLWIIYMCMYIRYLRNLKVAFIRNITFELHKIMMQEVPFSDIWTKMPGTRVPHNLIWTLETHYHLWRQEQYRAITKFISFFLRWRMGKRKRQKSHMSL